jgi:uncharacterized protein YacL
MKLMTAKIVYWTVVTAMIGVVLGLIISTLWFLISMIPYGIFFVIGLAVVVGLGLLMGWAESVMDKDKAYKSSGEKVRR